MKLKFSVREIVESAMLIALAIVFDLQGLKIQIGNGGGSISLTMVPLFVLALRVGFLKSFIGIGVIYGLITCLIDGWGIVYFPLDYLLAYGSISLIGLFKNIILDKNEKFEGILFLILSTLICLILRMIFHTISSMVFYDYSLVAAIAYNGPYVFVSGAATLVMLLLLYKPLLIINEKFKLKSID